MTRRRSRHRGARTILFLATTWAFVIGVTDTGAQGSVDYRLSFPEPEHRWMQVEATFTGVPAGPLELHMSRASPGRYSLHEFAKNVSDVAITGLDGGALGVSRPNPSQWRVAEHGSSVRVRYRVFGDRVDGTYLAVDTTHAHINMPAAVMWARGFEDRPVRVRFEPPPGSSWRVATQLYPDADVWTYTAPNLQYLMDSPSELGAFTLRTFTAREGDRTATFKVAVHHDGSDTDVDRFARDIQKVVAEARNVFGELAPFENDTYTFIADYLPWAAGDGMEHRNSTILTSPTTLRSDRDNLLGSVSHEFFHSWNVERIRPRALEPFNLDETNMSGELWLAEGFTNYYGPLVLLRAGLTSVTAFAAEIGEMVDTTIGRPGRRVRTLEEMSQLAPLVDRATSTDRTDFENTYISYYTWGGALAVGLDLTLRDRTNGRVTLDDFMRTLWREYGKVPGRPGYVSRPYTMADLKSVLAELAGDRAFADDFFTRFVQGHDVVDYARLMGLGGFALRQRAPGQASAGDIRVEEVDGQVQITALVPSDSPAYRAGLERDDVIVSIRDRRLSHAAEFEEAVRRERPGTAVPLVFERRGLRVSTTMTLIADPRVELVPAEDTGRTLTESEQRFRRAWLGSATRSSF